MGTYETKRKRAARAGTVLACVVAFTITYALILPAITLDRTPQCEKEEHVHTEACYSTIPLEGDCTRSLSQPLLTAEEREFAASVLPLEQIRIGLDADIEASEAGKLPDDPDTEIRAEDAAQDGRYLICGLEEHQHSRECYAGSTAQAGISERKDAADADPAASGGDAKEGGSVSSGSTEKETGNDKSAADETDFDVAANDKMTAGATASGKTASGELAIVDGVDAGDAADSNTTDRSKEMKDSDSLDGAEGDLGSKNAADKGNSGESLPADLAEGDLESKNAVAKGNSGESLPADSAEGNLESKNAAARGNSGESLSADLAEGDSKPENAATNNGSDDADSMNADDRSADETDEDGNDSAVSSGNGGASSYNQGSLMSDGRLSDAPGRPEDTSVPEALRNGRQKYNYLNRIRDAIENFFSTGWRRTAQVSDTAISAEYDKGILPETALMKVREVDPEEYSDHIAEITGRRNLTIKAFDISFRDGNDEVEPDGTVKVTFKADYIDEKTAPKIIHITDDGHAECIPADVADGKITLTADSFSVYVIAYTVDFSYSVDGETYDFSLPGGEKMNLSELAEALNIIGGTQFETVSDFIAEIKSVEFSDSSLVRITAVKEGGVLGIGAETVDWELKSLRAFDTEETLTITMKNGDVITVKVTDAQGSGSIQVSQVLEYQSGMNKINGERIYFALIKDGEYVTDSYGNIVYREMFMQDETLNPSTVTFTGLEDGEYEVWEMHGDPNNGSLNRSYDGMLMRNDTVEIDKIRVIANSNGLQNENGLYNNNVTIRDGSSESITFRNTYKPASDKTSFEANKVWMDRKEKVIKAPDEATIVFTLYKEVGGVTTSTGRTIVLNGISDNDGEANPWQAVFSDLPKTENGQTIRYKVKETSGWPDYYVCKNKGKNLMRDNEYLETSGGTIYNRHLLATIQIQKHFDIQPNKYSDADWAEVLAKKQLSFELTNEDTHETWYFTLDDSFKQNGQLFYLDVPNMQAGQYTLKEYRYKGLISGRKWDRGITEYTRYINPGDNMDNPLFEMEVQNWYVDGQDEPEGAYIRALKVWDDLEDFDGIRPESVTVRLSATVNGKVYEVENVTNPVTLSEENDWNTGNTWYNLPIEDGNGNKIVYTVAEENVPEGYTCTQSVSENGTDKSYTFTNTHRPQGTGKIKLKKIVQAPTGAMVPSKYYFTIQDSEGLYWTGHSTSGPDGYYTAVPVPIEIASNSGETEIELPVGRYTITEIRDGVEIDGYTLTVTGEGAFEVRTNQNDDVVVTNRYEEEIEPPDDKHIHIGLEKKWDDGNGNMTPPDGASATFTVHQLKQTVSGSEGNLDVQLVDGSGNILQTLKCSSEENISIDYAFQNGDGYAVVQYKKLRPDWGANGVEWVTIGNPMQEYNSGSYHATCEFKVSNDYQVEGTNQIVLKINANKAFITGPTLNSNGSGGVTYSDPMETSYTQEVTLPILNDNWSTVIKNLIQEDEEGNRYSYYITEDSCSPSAISTVFKDKLGRDADHAISTTGQTVEVTNTYKEEDEKGSVRVTKTFSGIDALPDNFRIAVSYSDNVTTGRPTELKLANADGGGNGTTGNPYTWTIDNLPKGTVVTFTESDYEVEGYTVTTTPEKSDGRVTVTATAEKTAGTAALVNTYTHMQAAELDVTIIKVDTNDTGTHLSGAKFELYRSDAEDDPARTKWGNEAEVDSDGKLTFEGLTEGYYKLVETKTPDGYVKTASDPWFHVKKEVDGTLSVEVVSGSESVLSYSTAEGAILVKNTPGVALPSTGGHGTTSIYFIGSMLIVLSGTMLMIRRRRKRI